MLHATTKPYALVHPFRDVHGVTVFHQPSQVVSDPIQIGSIYGPILGPIPRGLLHSDPIRNPSWNPPEILCSSCPTRIIWLHTFIPYPL